MKYLAAYALLVLAGNTAPSDNDVKKLLHEVGAEVNEEDVKRVVDALRGKQFHEVAHAGSSKLANVSFGGGAGASHAAHAGSSQPADKKEDAKKPAEVKPVVKVEEEVDALEGGLFGGDDEW